MGDKTIYIKSEYEQIFEEAEKLASLEEKSFSSLIGEALTEYVERKQNGYSQINLKVGEWSLENNNLGNLKNSDQLVNVNIKIIKFHGKNIAQLHREFEGGINDEWRIYYSYKGKLLVWLRRVDENLEKQIAANYKIFENIDEMLDEEVISLSHGTSYHEIFIPGKLINEAEYKLLDNKLPEKWLDI